jgi:hypothetical protein
MTNSHISQMFNENVMSLNAWGFNTINFWMSMSFAAVVTISTLTLNLLSGFSVITLVELDLPILTFRPAATSTHLMFNMTLFSNTTINTFPGNQTLNHASYNLMGPGSLTLIGLAVLITLVLAGVNRASPFPQPWKTQRNGRCNKKFIYGDKIYRCPDCSVSANKVGVMCADCFNASEHSVNQRKAYSKCNGMERESKGFGFCSCGDEEAFYDHATCNTHKDLNSGAASGTEPGTDNLENIPEDVGHSSKMKIGDVSAFLEGRHI